MSLSRAGPQSGNYVGHSTGQAETLSSPNTASPSGETTDGLATWLSLGWLQSRFSRGVWWAHGQASVRRAARNAQAAGGGDCARGLSECAGRHECVWRVTADEWRLQCPRAGAVRAALAAAQWAAGGAREGGSARGRRDSPADLRAGAREEGSVVSDGGASQRDGASADRGAAVENGHIEAGVAPAGELLWRGCVVGAWVRGEAVLLPCAGGAGSTDALPELVMNEVVVTGGGSGGGDVSVQGLASEWRALRQLLQERGVRNNKDSADPAEEAVPSKPVCAAPAQPGEQQRPTSGPVSLVHIAAQLPRLPRSLGGATANYADRVDLLGQRAVRSDWLRALSSDAELRRALRTSSMREASGARGVEWDGEDVDAEAEAEGHGGEGDWWLRRERWWSVGGAGEVVLQHGMAASVPVDGGAACVAVQMRWPVVLAALPVPPTAPPPSYVLLLLLALCAQTAAWLWAVARAGVPAGAAAAWVRAVRAREREAARALRRGGLCGAGGCTRVGRVCGDRGGKVCGKEGRVALSPMYAASSAARVSGHACPRAGALCPTVAADSHIPLSESAPCSPAAKRALARRRATAASSAAHATAPRLALLPCAAARAPSGSSWALGLLAADICAAAANVAAGAGADGWGRGIGSGGAEGICVVLGLAQVAVGAGIGARAVGVLLAHEEEGRVRGGRVERARGERWHALWWAPHGIAAVLLAGIAAVTVGAAGVAVASSVAAWALLWCAARRAARGGRQGLEEGAGLIVLALSRCVWSITCE